MTPSQAAPASARFPIHVDNLPRPGPLQDRPPGRRQSIRGGLDPLYAPSRAARMTRSSALQVQAELTGHSGRAYYGGYLKSIRLGLKGVGNADPSAALAALA